MSARVFLVNTNEELNQAIDNAQGGDRIELAPGNYGDVSIRRMTYDSEVLLASQDASRPAVFNSVSLSEVSNIQFKNLFFDFSPDASTVEWDSALRVVNSSNITVSGSRFEGGPSVAGVPQDSEPGAQGAEGILGLPHGRAMTFNWSKGITLENNEISQFSSGVRFYDATDVNLISNEIYEVRRVPVGGADVSNLNMEGNYFHDIQPWKFGGLGDHGDFVHFWINNSDSMPSENLYFNNNIFDQGNGVSVLGLYIEDNYDVGYKNIIFENNVIHNGNAQALRVENADGLYIRDNTLIQSSGDEKASPKVNLAYGNTNVDIENNIFSGVVGSDLENASERNINLSGNVIAQAHDVQAENHYLDLFVNSGASVFDIQVLPGSAADGVGAKLTKFDWYPDEVEPHSQVYSTSSANTLVFDASWTVGPAGLITDQDAVFLWSFEDGGFATGKVVFHDFGSPGNYDVTLSVVTHGHVVNKTHFNVGISGNELVQFDRHLGLFEVTAYGHEIALTNINLPTLSRDDGYVMKLGGEGTGASIPSSELITLFGTDSFELSMSLKAEGYDSWGEIARVHTSFTVGVDKQGNFVAQLYLENGSSVKMTSEGVSLNDRKVHDVVFDYNGETGLAQMIVDGKIAASESVSGSLGGGPRALTFGNPWGDQNFSGELSGFSLSAETKDFPVYAGELELNSDAMVGEPEAPEAGSNGENSLGEPIVDDAMPADDAGSLVPFLLDGYEVDFASVSKSVLKYDAHITEAGGQYSFSLDGEKDYVHLGRLKDYEGVQKIGFSVEFKKDSDEESAQRLVWNHMKVGLTLEGDKLRIHAANNDNPFWKGFQIEGLNINDGKAHSAVVLVDGGADRLQVLVDDVLVLDERDTDFDLVGGREAGWTLGTPWDRWFEGEIYDFTVSNDFTFLDTGPEDSYMLA